MAIVRASGMRTSRLRCFNSRLNKAGETMKTYKGRGGGESSQEGPAPSAPLKNTRVNKAGAPNFWDYSSPSDYSSPQIYKSPPEYGSPFQYGPERGFGGGGRNGGGGGGGGGGRGDGGFGYGGFHQKHSFLRLITLIYGALMTIGGLMGYIKKGSWKSAIAGGICGMLLFYSFLLMQTDPTKGLELALGLAVILTLVFGVRYAKSKAMVPSGLLTGLSLSMTGLYLSSV